LSKDTAKKMPITEHLAELRRRLVYCAIAVFVCMVGAFVAKKYVFAVLMHPLKDTGVQKLTTLGVTEAFFQVLKVSVYAGLIVALPFILYQFWAFVLPALYENERRSVIPYVASTTGLFLGGVVFGYFIVLPVGLKFLVGYGGEQFNQLLQAERYINFVAMFLLAFGAVFELPLIMMLLAWADIVDHVRMRKARRYAIVIEAVVAMVLTPSQDPVSMILMLVPLIVLYEIGIWLAKWVARRKARKAFTQLPEAGSAGS